MHALTVQPEQQFMRHKVGGRYWRLSGHPARWLSDTRPDNTANNVRVGIPANMASAVNHNG